MLDIRRWDWGDNDQYVFPIAVQICCEVTSNILLAMYDRDDFLYLSVARMSLFCAHYSSSGLFSFLNAYAIYFLYAIFIDIDPPVLLCGALVIYLYRLLYERLSGMYRRYIYPFLNSLLLVVFLYDLCYL